MQKLPNHHLPGMRYPDMDTQTQKSLETALEEQKHFYKTLHSIRSQTRTIQQQRLALKQLEKRLVLIHKTMLDLVDGVERA